MAARFSSLPRHSTWCRCRSPFAASDVTTSGAPGGPSAGDPSKPPMTQVMDSILGMALQLPALKSIGESIGVDLSSAVTPGSSAAATSAPSSKKS